MAHWTGTISPLPVVARPVATPLRNLLLAILGWQQRARERHLLAELDNRLLRDIGLTRADVATEFGKPFWRP